jgi:hypothetical protein
MAASKSKTLDAKVRKGASLFRLQGKALQLRKKLVKELMVCCGALCVLAAVQYLFADWEDAQTASRDKLHAAVLALDTEKDTLERRLSKAQKVAPLYVQIFKDTNKPELELDRRQAAQLIEKLKEEYLFASLRVGMSPPVDIKDAKFNNKFVAAQAVQIDLSIEALSDEHVLKFLNQLRQEMPGKLKITSFTLTKLTNPTPQVLALVLQSGKVGLVRSDIQISWMGFKFIGTVPPPTPAPAAKEGGA